MWLSQLLERNTQCFGDRTAIVDERRHVTWRELDRRVENLALGLGHSGVRHGDRVAVLSRDRIEVLEVYFALARLGAVFVPVNHGLLPAEVAEITERSRVMGIIGEASLLDRLGGTAAFFALSFEDPRFDELAERPNATASAPADVRIDDLAAIIHTSATTGRTKGVVVDHRSFKDISLGWLAAADPTSEMVLVNCCPLFHGSMTVSLTYLAAGATVVLLSEFSPQAALRAIEQHQATHVWLVPEMLRFLLRARSLERIDLSSLREVMYGAAPMPSELYAEAAARLGCGFRQVYGMTEVGGPFVMLAPDEHPRPGADGHTLAPIPAGRVIPGMSARIMDDDGRPALVDEIGEVCVRGDGLMRGYWDDPHGTAEIMIDGWLRTGDMGRMDANGYIFLVDRRKDIVIRGGQNVYPAEVEKVLRQHPAVEDAGVVGVADQDWGEVPVAFVVLRGGLVVAPEEIMRHLVAHLAGYKRPREIRFVEDLPRNGAGKMLKKILRDRAQAAPV